MTGGAGHLKIRSQLELKLEPEDEGKAEDMVGQAWKMDFLDKYSGVRTVPRGLRGGVTCGR